MHSVFSSVAVSWTPVSFPFAERTSVWNGSWGKESSSDPIFREPFNAKSRDSQSQTLMSWEPLTVNERCPSSRWMYMSLVNFLGDEQAQLTNILENRPFLLENGMEEPASSQWPDGGLNTMALSANHFDFNPSFRVRWISTRDTVSQKIMSKNRIITKCKTNPAGPSSW